jgi:hypothetical protein
VRFNHFACFIVKRNVAQSEVAGVVEQFVALGEDPQKFNAFLSRVA